MLGRKHTEESKIKMTNSLYKLYKNGYVHSMKGKKHTVESRRNISNGCVGRKLSDTHKANISKANKGKTLQELNHKPNCQ
jgi:hypothetical protein